MKMMSKWAFMAVVSLSAIVALCLTSNNTETTLPLTNSSRFDSSAVAFLEYDFYQTSCPQAEAIVLRLTRKTVMENANSTAQLLRLMFHDCFIEGCDASVLIAGFNGSSTERDAIPNKTLKGFQFIDMIKEEIEKECPGIVSCADILVLSVRDSIVMTGGPFYPISTGRRDSSRAFQEKAEAEIPRPMSNVSEVLRLFSLRGLDERETTALLGGHNIGHIGCQFLAPRFLEFSSFPDPTMDPIFFEELRQKCLSNASSIPNRLVPSRPSRHLSHTSHKHSSTIKGSMTPHAQELISVAQPFSSFDGHYFRSLIAGKGILFSDQQLMSFEKTVKVVQEYASDDAKFRLDFARAMMKLSNLGVLTGSQGLVRRNCSIPVNG